MMHGRASQCAMYVHNCMTPHLPPGILPAHLISHYSNDKHSLLLFFQFFCIRVCSDSGLPRTAVVGVLGGGQLGRMMALAAVSKPGAGHGAS